MGRSLTSDAARALHFIPLLREPPYWRRTLAIPTNQRPGQDVPLPTPSLFFALFSTYIKYIPRHTGAVSLTARDSLASGLPAPCAGSGLGGIDLSAALSGLRFMASSAL